MLLKLSALCIFLSFGFLAIMTYEHYEGDIQWLTAAPGKRISIIIERDFKNLAKGGTLPDDWKRILRINYKMNSPVLQALMGDDRPQLRNIFPNTTGEKKKKPAEDNYEAEVEVIDVPDEHTPGFILQISLINLNSKNKIFEIGRTYYLTDLNKKKPD